MSIKVPHPSPQQLSSPCKTIIDLTATLSFACWLPLKGTVFGSESFQNPKRSKMAKREEVGLLNGKDIRSIKKIKKIFKKNIPQTPCTTQFKVLL